MKLYRVKGEFFMGERTMQPFTNEMAAKSEAEARDKIMALYGSKHKVNRRQINITEVKAIRVEDSQDPIAAARMEGAK